MAVNHEQRFSRALLTVAQQDNPPRRWIAGADAVAAIEQKANDLLAQADAYRELSSALATTTSDGAVCDERNPVRHVCR